MAIVEVQTSPLEEVFDAIDNGNIIPYLGHDCFLLDMDDCKVPISPEILVKQITDKVSVPHKIRTNLPAASQFIENFKHRKTLVNLMNAAFSPGAQPNGLHRYLASLNKKPLLIVDTWYDDTMAKTLQGRRGWGQIQGISQSEHFGEWVHYFDPEGHLVDASDAESWELVLYKPLGSVYPAANFIVSDSDFVEVLTEIDIQTPIPKRVQELRVNSHFLFLGCRFNHQLTRSYARQIMKRSSAKHWAVIEGSLTRMEEKFLEEQGIARIEMPLAAFLDTVQNRQSQNAP